MCVCVAASSLTVLLVCVVVIVSNMNATELCVGLQCVRAVCVSAVTQQNECNTIKDIFEPKTK